MKPPSEIRDEIAVENGYESWERLTILRDKDMSYQMYLDLLMEADERYDKQLKGKSRTKTVPLKHFLGNPLNLKTGKAFYEKELDEAIIRYEKQFKCDNEPEPEISAEEFIAKKIGYPLERLKEVWDVSNGFSKSYSWFAEALKEYHRLNSYGKTDHKQANSNLILTATQAGHYEINGVKIYFKKGDALNIGSFPSWVSDEKANKMLKSLLEIHSRDGLFEAVSAEDAYKKGFVFSLDWVRSLIFKEGKPSTKNENI